MALTKPMPFRKFSIHIDPVNWTVPDDKKNRMLHYIEQRIKHIFALAAAQKIAYHEQCERARAWLENFLTNALSDSRLKTRLETILTIQGEFGEPPDLAEVSVEYLIC